MDDRGTERRGLRLGIGEHQTIPELRMEPQRRCGCTDLPGLLAVGRRRGNGVVLILAREGAGERAPPRFAPLAWISGQGRPPRCGVHRTARYLARIAGRLELRQAHAPIPDE